MLEYYHHQIQPKLQSSESTFAPIFWPNFAVSELEKTLQSSDNMDELCNCKLQSSDIHDELGSIFLCAETAKFGHSGRTFQFTEILQSSSILTGKILNKLLSSARKKPQKYTVSVQKKILQSSSILTGNKTEMF